MPCQAAELKKAVEERLKALKVHHLFNVMDLECLEPLCCDLFELERLQGMVEGLECLHERHIDVGLVLEGEGEDLWVTSDGSALMKAHQALNHALSAGGRPREGQGGGAKGTQGP